MIRRKWLAVGVGLTVALGTTSMAFAAATDTQDAAVDGKISPAKLDKKKYKPVKLFTGVRTEVQGGVTGTQSNPLSEYLSYPKNIKINLNGGATCSTLPPSGSTPAQARAACPSKSYLGEGDAQIQGPGGVFIDDITVSVFRGPSKNGVQLHTYSPTLLAAAPTVLGSIVKSNAGGKFGSALSVPHAPETGSLMLTGFNATINKSSKFATARCKSKKMTYQRKVTYADGSSEIAETTQKCKQKKSKKH
jgi:hypothetical protein